jgi:Leu/Phe-tRNA-protein transferase
MHFETLCIWNPGIIWNPMGEQMHEEGTFSRVASHCQDKRLESFQWISATISIEMCRDLQSEGEAFSFVAQA